MTNSVKLIECPRDAWQGLKGIIPSDVKVNYLKTLISAGFKHIDAVSFVSPSAVPQMADSEEVLKELESPNDVEIIGIVVNEKGAQRAIDTQAVSTLGFPYSVSETFLRKNQNQSPEGALDELEKIQKKADGAGLDMVVYISMAFGNPYGDAWSIDEAESRPFIQRALEGGINFFDTANRYSLGSSEEILGRAIKDFTRRDEVVIATKVYGRMRPGPNGGGLSRKAIMREIDDSLQRLGTDYVDLYQIHRWDYGTPIEETLEALHDIVKAGKARYIGASSMHAWQFARALAVSERHGWTRFVSMQNLVNLLYREEEREMLPLCAAEGIGVIPWSPQARGRLTRDWDYTSIRTETDDAHQRLFGRSAEADRKVVDRVAEVAKARGIPRAQVALAWLLAKPVITAPIVGATKLHHLDDALASVNVKLSADEITSLEEPYVPHAVVGFV